MNLIELAERGALPDRLIRLGARRLMAARLRLESQGGVEAQRERWRRLVDEWRRGPIAIETRAANVQHYEVPAEFFQNVLGPRLKYSCCYYPAPATTLAEAEEAMLELFCRRAGIEDGMHVLELGCGWGSLCLWIAEKYPACRVLAVSNSRTQRDFILAQCRRSGFGNIEIQTADVADFTTDRQFDRVVSVEMFEHIRNHEELLRRVAGWLKPDGKLMVHVFCHRRYAYPFETEGDDNWMGRYFFTGGIMPSDDLLPRFQRDLLLEDHWSVSGNHYARTLEDWLVRCDAQRDRIEPLFQAILGETEGTLQVQRWRMFFMICAELFAYHSGDEWFVSHYLFSKRGRPCST